MKSEVRIIAGQWRGRKLPVVDVAGLRPTPDRIRETLFNWLAADCRDAVVLDCFAGSGALGLEALSRGARRLVAIERDRRALENLEQLRTALGDSRFELLAGDAARLIGGLDTRFDIVFIDPPYAAAAQRLAILGELEGANCLREGARLYFEWPRGGDGEPHSPRLQWLKRKSAGQVDYGVAEWRRTG
ncbi:MAG: 16S rRNA (guanine(966)-N(2))-methyltransferase RsmD [Gammaproteobacteria bacterium]|nr:16S rRNA (guanine(966)-N(2))-methyltransferase RsmD [Gammaproteobacteria bacterium]